MFSKTVNAAARGPYSIGYRSAMARARIALGLTKAEAAKRCRVSLRTYERVEAGDVVSRHTKVAVERALGMRL